MGVRAAISSMSALRASEKGTTSDFFVFLSGILFISFSVTTIKALRHSA